MIRVPMLFMLSVMASLSVAQPIVLEDMLGNEIVLATSAQGAVTLPMPAGSMWLFLSEDSRRLIGMHPSAYEYMQQGLLARIFPNTAHIRDDVTRSGFTQNVETLLQMQPDLILQWGHMGDELLAPLRQAGLPVAALLYGNETRVKAWIQLMGKALGKEDKVSDHLAWRTEVEQSIRQATSHLTTQQRPRVLHFSRYAPQYQVAGGNGNFHYDIELAGGLNVAAELSNGNIVHIEQILQWNPDVILLNNFEPNLSPETIYNNPLLIDVAAVKQRRVYKIPAGGYRWDPPSQESPLYWQWLSQVLHPDLFQSSLRDVIRDRFMHMYNYEVSDQDLDLILQMDQNTTAMHYGQFKK